MKKHKKIWLVLLLLSFTTVLYSCSEESEDEEEYADWQIRNDEYQTKWFNNSSLKKIRVFSQDPATEGAKSDYIYVEVLEEVDSSASECPLYTDTCRIAYRGRLIPSKSYPEGYVFDQSYTKDFSWTTANAIQGASWKDGFATALLNMHIGDRWRVYIPYQLMYGTSSGTSYPAYSNMIFDVALFDFWHPGELHPAFKTRTN